MLLVNGTVDFSTPPTALDEARPYWHKAQMVLLPEFSHVEDEYTLQAEAFERLITSYLDTGVGDDSLYVYQPLRFKPGMSLTVMAKAAGRSHVVHPAGADPLRVLYRVARRMPSASESRVKRAKMKKSMT